MPIRVKRDEKKSRKIPVRRDTPAGPPNLAELTPEQLMAVNAIVDVRARAMQDARNAGMPQSPPEPLPSSQWTGSRMVGESPAAQGDIAQLLAMMQQRDMRSNVPQAVGPQAVRGQPFREHVMGPAFDQPAPPPMVNEAVKAMLLADALAKERELQGAGMVNIEGPGGTVRGKVGSEQQDKHIDYMKRRAEAKAAGVPENELPPMIAIGRTGSDSGKLAAQEQAAIKAAGERREARRIRVKQSPQAEAVAQRGMARAQNRRIRVHGFSPQDYAALSSIGPAGMAAAGLPPWLIQTHMQQQATRDELASRERIAKMEGEQARGLLERKNELENPVAATPQPPDWSNPSTVFSQPDATPEHALDYGPDAINGPLGDQIKAELDKRFSPAQIAAMLNGTGGWFGEPSQRSAAREALRRKYGMAATTPYQQPQTAPSPSIGAATPNAWWGGNAFGRGY